MVHRIVPLEFRTMFNFRHEFTVPNIGFDTLFHFFEILMLLDDFVFVFSPIFFVFYNRTEKNGIHF